MQTGLNLTCASAGMKKADNSENPETEVCIWYVIILRVGRIYLFINF